MNKRLFLKTALVSVTGLAAVSVATRATRDNSVLSLDAANQRIDKAYQLAKDSRISARCARDFVHCAQSIEYAMTGYPEHKSPWFKATVGSLAFHAFSLAGRMHHDVYAPIPGAPEVLPAPDLDLAYQRLVSALHSLAIYPEPPHPHFAYGELTHQQTLLAQIMHINNHLEETGLI